MTRLGWTSHFRVSCSHAMAKHPITSLELLPHSHPEQQPQISKQTLIPARVWFLASVSISSLVGSYMKEGCGFVIGYFDSKSSTKFTWNPLIHRPAHRSRQKAPSLAIGTQVSMKTRATFIMPLLEIACFTTKSALLAQAHGASRVELCAEQALGGVTPLLSDYISVKSKLSIPINVMIRPRGGDFVYNAAEMEQMKREIEIFGAKGVDGFVFGVLTAEGKVDRDACRELLGRTSGKKCTFHRAFDEISEAEMEDALEELIELGFTSVLTSGGKKNAVEGKEVLARLVRRARGRIEIIVGGGVRSGNLEVLMKETGAEAFHSSAVVGEGDVANGEEVERLSALLR